MKKNNPAATRNDVAPICPGCNARARIAHGGELFPHRVDLRARLFWVCTPCDTRVGCHPGGTEPLGKMATERERTSRAIAHKHFDQLWERGEMTRYQAYGWLAAALGMSRDRCHIGRFDSETCARVIEVCKARKEAP